MGDSSVGIDVNVEVRMAVDGIEHPIAIAITAAIIIAIAAVIAVIISDSETAKYSY